MSDNYLVLHKYHLRIFFHGEQGACRALLASSSRTASITWERLEMRSLRPLPGPTESEPASEHPPSVMDVNAAGLQAVL